MTRFKISLCFDTETGRANFIDWYMKHGEQAFTYRVKAATADALHLVPPGNACQYCEYWDSASFGAEGQPERCPRCKCVLWETKKANG